ncbi:MAG: aminotransferase class V-fold PLP-dependent enzyme, partial [Chthonomonas sp.]|nr:aminotransferase class V-fold PLP-dependent enzyme [Chthonomonas sp.]
MSVNRIYCDHAATTPLDPAVLEAMLPWLSTEFGNASSLYAEGRRAKDALDEAREALSAAVECLFAEVVFTSSATESINLGLLGVARAAVQGTRKRILLSAYEHPAFLECRVALERMGYTVELIP